MNLLNFPTSMEDIQQLPPIPRFEKSVNAAGYRNIPVQSDHPLFCEALVDIRDYNIAGESYYHRLDGKNRPYCCQLEGSIPEILVRKSVAEKLKEVNHRLRQIGLELFVWDAYRPLATQIGIWKFFEEAQRKNNPLMTNEEIYEEVIKYVSDPQWFRSDDPSTWPTHMSGASVDLTIRHIKEENNLEMGAYFDQMDCTANTIHFEEQLERRLLPEDDTRILNRRLLYYAMVTSGFTNYPLEYWHFDWGNQMNQMIRSASNGNPPEPAWYGAVIQS